MKLQLVLIKMAFFKASQKTISSELVSHLGHDINLGFTWIFTWIFGITQVVIKIYYNQNIQLFDKNLIDIVLILSQYVR